MGIKISCELAKIHYSEDGQITWGLVGYWQETPEGLTQGFEVQIAVPNAGISANEIPKAAIDRANEMVLAVADQIRASQH